MKLLCAKPHYASFATYREASPQPYLCETFGEWLFHQVAWHVPLWWFMFLVFKVGCVDGEGEFAAVRWRWDFWNSWQKAEARRRRAERESTVELPGPRA